MSHEVESAFFTRIGAWHGEGLVRTTAPSIKEALRDAGLDWEVERRAIYDSAGTKIPGHFAVTRVLDNSVLGVVQAKYRPLQNWEAFEHFRPMVESGAVELEAAGSLRGGKRVWILARIKGLDAEVKDGDPIRAYYMLSHGHDGGAVVSCQFTPIRVVCMNTLRASLGSQDAETVRLKHTRHVVDALDIVRETLDFTRQTFNVSLEQYRAMARMGLDVRSFRQYVRNVFEVPESEEQMPRAWETLEGLFDGQAIGSRLAEGTVWGAYNAVTEWIDHARGRTDESRFEAAQFGAGAALRARAHEEAVALISS